MKRKNKNISSNYDLKDDDFVTKGYLEHVFKQELKAELHEEFKEHTDRMMEQFKEWALGIKEGIEVTIKEILKPSNEKYDRWLENHEQRILRIESNEEESI